MPQAFEHHHIAHTDAAPPMDLAHPVHLEEGTCYLIRGKAIETSYRLFQSLVDRSTAGFCASRIFPERVRERYGLTDGPIWWISNSPGDEHVNPTALGTLSSVIEVFIGDHPDGSVVLLDGIEFIISNVGFDKALQFLEHLSDFVMPRHSILLVAVDPACFDPKEFARLERFHASLDAEEVRKAIDSCDLEQTLLFAH